jgi:hypothetical protein
MALWEPDLDSAAGKQEGWLGEYEVDRALTVGSRWRLLPYLPLFDTRHVDRAYAWDGIGRPQFVQVKTALGPRSDGFFQWRIHADTFEAYRNFSVVLAGADPVTLRIGYCWRLDSRLISRFAKRTRIPESGKEVYNLWASTRTHDGLSRYRRRPQDLWKDFAPPPVQRLMPGFPNMPSDEGDYFEYAFVASCLAEGDDQLLCYRPAADVVGRDMLIQLANTWRAIYLQIKGTARVEGRRSVHCSVQRAGFIAGDDFWLAFYYYDRERSGMFEHCWLVPSQNFAEVTRSQSVTKKMTFTANLDPEQDRWVEFRHRIDSQGKVLRAALHRLVW